MQTTTKKAEKVEKTSTETLEPCSCPVEMMRPKVKEGNNSAKKKKTSQKKKIVDLVEKPLGKNKTGSTNYSKTFEFQAMKEARSAEKAAIRHSGKKFWDLAELSIIGSSLYTRFMFNRMKHKHQDQESSGRETEKTEVKQSTSAEDVRSNTVRQCKMLIERCGSIQELEKRDDDCVSFLEEAMGTFQIGRRELE